MSVASARGLLIAAAIGVAACGASRAATGEGAHGAPGSQAVAARTRQADWPAFDFDSRRSGAGPTQTGITAGNVHALRVRVVRLDGTVDSSPIQLDHSVVRGRARDVVLLTTTYGKTIAIDPGTGARLWEYTPRDIRSYAGSSQITNATPIADPDGQYVYAASPDGLIHKLRVSSGAEIHSGAWPARITFDAHREKLSSALNVVGRDVIAVTAGYFGDQPIYEGHVVEIDRASGRIVAVWNADCSDRRTLLDPPSSCRSDTTFGGSAIWARAGAVVEPGGTRILVATGNGPFDGRTNWGDSVLELSASGLRLLHNWTPPDQASLDAGDGDLGSTAPAVLPTVGGWHLAVQGGKDGKLHVLNLNRLDGTSGPAGPRLGGEVQGIGAPGSGQVLTAPAVWRHGGRSYVFVADDSGTVAYAVHGGRHPGLSMAWSSGHAGTSPIVAGGLLYVYDEGSGVLRVYGPVRGNQLAALPAADGHWNSPIVDGGRIVLPTGNANDRRSSGELFIFHVKGR